MDAEEIKSILNSFDELKESIEWLESELSDLTDELWEIECKIKPLQHSIHNVGDFKFRAKADNVLTPELEEWVDDYTRFYND